MSQYIKNWRSFLAMVISSILLVEVGESAYRWIDNRVNETSFQYVCALVLPRLQLGANREVQDTLLFLFSKDVASGHIFPFVEVGDKLMAQKNFETDTDFRCEYDSVPDTKILFQYSSFSMSLALKSILAATLFIIINILVTLSQKYFETRAKARARVIIETQLGQVARQVAHDIRSPLSALNSAVNINQHTLENKDQLIQNATKRIQDIANDLLLKYKVDPEAIEDLEIATVSVEPLTKAIEEVILEKLANYPGVTISFDKPEDGEIFAKCNIVDFQRILANLIQNSIEAYNDHRNSKIEVAVRRYGRKTQISVSDKGRGIPEEVLSQVGKEGFSHKKKNGNGLGVSFSKRKVNTWGGQFNIFSQVDQGTVVTVILKNT